MIVPNAKPQDCRMRETCSSPVVMNISSEGRARDWRVEQNKTREEGKPWKKRTE